MEKKKVLLGMSGGVDSTFAASRLVSEGYTVEGALLLMSEHTDIESARAAAEKTGIPLHIIDCKADFREKVIDNFVSEYMRARTPNPCIVCNREVKIKKLCDFAREHGFDAVVTGHYAGVGFDEASERYFIKRGADDRKDQSYMLWRLTQEELSLLYFPLEESIKSEIKRESEERGLIERDKKESQEICFIPTNDHAAFIEEYTGKRFPTGDFTDENGKVLGTHKGIIKYTVGQRKGLGISLGKHAFVLSVNAGDGTIVLGDEEGLFKSEFSVSDTVFQKRVYAVGERASLEVKIRYAARPAKCEVEFAENGAHITLEAPARAITPGQSAVFYENCDIIFGGFIN